MQTSLTIRIPSELAQQLEQRRQNADLNVSAFCRRAIERALADATPAPARTPVLIAQKASIDGTR
jgi:post-segregation antitoxin (ccd killing protein)